MNLGGWIIFLVSNITVIALVVFCFYQVFSIPEEHMHGPLDIDTHDHDDNTDENPGQRSEL